MSTGNRWKSRVLRKNVAENGHRTGFIEKPYPRSKPLRKVRLRQEPCTKAVFPPNLLVVFFRISLRKSGLAKDPGSRANKRPSGTRC
jgi:hypothetical protein